MCGIAGYSLSPESGIDRKVAAQVLLAAIAERGADAVGYGWRGGGPEVTIHKQRTGATALLDQVEVPDEARNVLVHVRDYTKGHPTIAANNHPIRHGAVVGIHNGIIVNDDELFHQFGFERATPEMTVDSEAIFALVESEPGRASVLDRLHGSMAAAWMDERRPDTLFLARGVGRPLWVGRGPREVFFASTRAALELLERYLRTSLLKRELDEGRLAVLVSGRIVSTERFNPDRSFREERQLPAVRAPHEGASCLQRLAALLPAR